MPARFLDMGGRHRARHAFAVLLAIASLAAVATLGVVVIQAQDHARSDAIERFDERGTVVARLLSGKLQQWLASAAADTGQALSGDVDESDLRDLQDVGDSVSAYSAVLSADGTVLAAHPSDTPIGDTDDSRAAIDAAADGTATVTDVIPRGDRGDVVEFVMPITTNDGERRIFVLAYPPEVVGASVAGTISEAVDVARGAAFVTDSRGVDVLAIGDEDLQRRIGPVVRDAVRDGRDSGVSGGVRYVVEPLEGTALRFAYALPVDAVTAGLPNRLWARLAVGALALAMLAVLALAARAMRDARRLDAARREADAANVAKGQLLAHVSHELKTPIAVIRGFAGLLHRTDLDVRESGYVDRIDESSQHLYRLADDLLEVSRIEAGRVALALERVDARSIVDEVLVLVAPLAEERRIRLEPPTLREKIRPILADPMRLRQVLLNLLSNAIKYNRDGGIVRVALETDDDAVSIAVTDTGPGIAPEDVGRLFQPFERLSVDRDVVRGTGLGLCVTKGLLEAMGGSISVASDPGQGSTFTVALPASREGEEVASPRVEPAATATSGRIVYIDDSDASLELVERIVGEERPGLMVRTASDGSSGLELVRAEPTDLLLLDLNLPDMHGEAVLAQLRADPLTAGLPVLVVSADSTSRDVTRLLRTGADAYLTKPLDDVQFLGVVDRLLAPRI